MKHTGHGDPPIRWLPWIATLFLLGGCTIAGTWKRVATDPPEAPFPVDDLLLDGDGNYSAQWDYEGRKYGSYGTYEYRGGELIVTQSGSMPRTYGARLRLDGRLELTLTVHGDSIQAVLERQQPKLDRPTEPDGQAGAPPDEHKPAPEKPPDADRNHPVP